MTAGRHVQSIPEEKYIRETPSGLSRRFAWLKVAGVSLVSTVPLLAKGVVNLLDVAVAEDWRVSLAESKKNFISAGLVMGAAPIALVSAVVSPEIGSYFIRKQIFTAPYYYQDYVKRRADFLKKSTDNISTSKDTVVVTVYEEEGKPLRNIVLPPGSQAKTLTGLNCKIDVLDILCRVSTPYWRIYCCGQGSFSENWVSRIIKENEALGCNTRVYTNPGIKRNERVHSVTDLVNACITVTYDLCKTMKWSKKDAQKYLHIYARSLGVGIALQVDCFFTKNESISFMVFADRSFSSLKDAMAARLHRMTGMPLVLTHSLSSQVLLASGGWDLDSIRALSVVDPRLVYPVNLAMPSAPLITRRDVWLRTKQKDADAFIPDESQFCEGIKKAGIHCGNTTEKLLKQFQTDGQRVYPKTIGDHNHDAPLTELSMRYPFNEQYSALRFYANVLHEYKSMSDSRTLTESTEQRHYSASSSNSR